MKKCNDCNELKSLNDFNFRWSKNKKVKYYNPICKVCRSIRYNPGSKPRANSPKITSKCFYCNKTYTKIKPFKYCSIKCKSQGISERTQFMNEIGINYNPFYHGETY